jgi:hypothetical protein
MRISLECPLAAAFALGFALQAFPRAGRGKTSRHYTSGVRGRSAVYRRSDLRRSKTAWPSRFRMRKATVLGGNARFAAATIAADTSDA